MKKSLLMQNIEKVAKNAGIYMRFYDVRKGKVVKYRLKIMLKRFLTNEELANIAALKGVVKVKNYYAKNRYWRTYNEKFVCIYLNCKLRDAY